MCALLLVQMSGCPGSGKSTLAREIGRRTDAAVLDHDVIKSVLLRSGVDWEMAGPTAYRVLRALGQSLLRQGQSVILDSPCYYQELLDAGLQMAADAGACYRYVECVLEDVAELSRRLQSRTALPSQRPDIGIAPAGFVGTEVVSGAELFQEWMRGMKRPAHPYLRVDTALPLADCLSEVFTFLQDCNRRP